MFIEIIDSHWYRTDFLPSNKEIIILFDLLDLQSFQQRHAQRHRRRQPFKKLEELDSVDVLLILIVSTKTNVHPWRMWESERSYKIVRENYFCVHHKNRRKHNQHFELLFFMINYLSTRRIINLFLINRICLVYFSPKIRRKLIQTEVCYKSFYSFWKKKSHKPSKV